MAREDSTPASVTQLCTPTDTPLDDALGFAGDQPVGGGTYRGHLEHQINMSEDAELRRLEQLLDTRDEAGADRENPFDVDDTATSDAGSLVYDLAIVNDLSEVSTEVDVSDVDSNVNQSMEEVDLRDASDGESMEVDICDANIDNGDACADDKGAAGEAALDADKGAAGEAALDAQLAEPIIPRGDSRCIVFELERPTLAMFDGHPNLLVNKSESTSNEQSRPPSKDELHKRLKEMTHEELDFEWAAMLAAAPAEVREELNRPEWSSVRDALSKASADTLRRLIVAWGTMQCANAEVTPFANVLSATVRCNTAHLHLGAREASRCAMFYMVKYLTKDSTALDTCLSTLLDAQRNARRWQSTADDRNTPTRDALWFLQKCVNRFHKEITDTQAASLLLGDTAHVCSETFHYASPWQISEAAAQCRTELGHDIDSFTGDVDGDTGMHHATEDDGAGDKFQTVGGDSRWARENDARAPHPGYSKTYTLEDGTTIVVPVEKHYRFRGALLAGFNYMEWESCVDVVAMTEEERETREASIASLALAESGALPLQDRELDAARRGAKPAGCFPFHAAHPLARTHWQRLRRTVHCLLHSGKTPPQEPKPPAAQSAGQRRHISQQWLQKRQDFAQYMVANFVPWAVSSNDDDPNTANDNCPPDLSPDALRAWMSQLKAAARADEAACADEAGSERHVARGRLFEIHHYVHALVVSTQNKHVLSQFRGRNRTMWTQAEQQERRPPTLLSTPTMLGPPPLRSPYAACHTLARPALHIYAWLARMCTLACICALLYAYAFLVCLHTHAHILARAHSICIARMHMDG